MHYKGELPVRPNWKFSVKHNWTQWVIFKMVSSYLNYSCYHLELMCMETNKAHSWHWYRWCLNIKSWNWGGICALSGIGCYPLEWVLPAVPVTPLLKVFRSLTQMVIAQIALKYITEHLHAIKNIEYPARRLYWTVCKDKNILTCNHTTSFCTRLSNLEQLLLSECFGVKIQF